MCPVWKRTLPPSCTCRVTGNAADVANISASNVIPLVFALPLFPDFKLSPKDQIGERFVILHSLLLTWRIKSGNGSSCTPYPSKVPWRLGEPTPHSCAPTAGRGWQLGQRSTPAFGCIVFIPDPFGHSHHRTPLFLFFTGPKAHGVQTLAELSEAHNLR